MTKDPQRLSPRRTALPPLNSLASAAPGSAESIRDSDLLSGTPAEQPLASLLPVPPYYKEPPTSPLMPIVPPYQQNSPPQHQYYSRHPQELYV